MILILNRFAFCFLLFLIGTLGPAFAQEGLNNTFQQSHIKRHSIHKPLKQLYKRPGKNRMYSNDCVHDYTVSKGFEYVILTGDCEKALNDKSGFELELHNFGTGFGLVFTRGPFWKAKVKKHYKLCKERMGDVIE